MVEASRLPEGTVRVQPSIVHDFLSSAFRSQGVSVEHAELIADVLVTADLRGIRSHGVARLSYFLIRLERGVLNRDPAMSFTPSSDTTGVLDADNAIGIVAADRAMAEAMTMAELHGSGFVTVKNSSHFGYAGYWANQAMQRGFIGISMSNSGRRVTPTFGLEAILGTNPISVTIPGGSGKTDFFLDMATSAVAVGKIETALREDRDLPDGWVAGTGRPRLDEHGVLDYESPLAPLGGEGDATGGHKGYGLALMVELLCGALNGSSLNARMAGADGSAAPAMGHFMGAIKVSGFRPPEQVHAGLAETFDIVRRARKAPGHGRIYIHGEPESIAEEENRRIGMPITPAVLGQLRQLSDRYGLDFDLE